TSRKVATSTGYPRAARLAQLPDGHGVVMAAGAVALLAPPGRVRLQEREAPLDRLPGSFGSGPRLFAGFLHGTVGAGGSRAESQEQERGDHQGGAEAGRHGRPPGLEDVARRGPGRRDRRARQLACEGLPRSPSRSDSPALRRGLSPGRPPGLPDHGPETDDSVRGVTVATDWGSVSWRLVGAMAKPRDRIDLSGPAPANAGPRPGRP